MIYVSVEIAIDEDDIDSWRAENMPWADIQSEECIETFLNENEGVDCTLIAIL